MLKLSLLSLLFIILARSEAQMMPVSAHMEGGQETYVFGDTVFIRSSPGTASSILDTLYEGLLVTIVRKTEETSFFRGFHAPWFHVKYRKDENEREGFIWSGLLALQPARRGNTKFIYGIDRVFPKRNNEPNSSGQARYQVKVKAVVDVEKRAVESFPVEEESAVFTSASISTGNGLEGVQHLIAITFGGEACGIPAYTHYYAWTGSELKKLVTLRNVSDAGQYYYTEDLVFPNQKGGRPGHLVVQIRAGESTGKANRDGEPLYREKKSQKIYRWSETELKLLNK